MAIKYWLMKSEPDVYSLGHLKKDKTTWWEGVRNYQARNFMMKDMALGDWVLFYHSNAEPSGIAGLAKVSALAQPDSTQFDKKSEYYDEKSTKEAPRWLCVQVEYFKEFKNFLSLDEIKKQKPLAGMGLLKKGNRLSIQPVTSAEFEFIKKLGGL